MTINLAHIGSKRRESLHININILMLLLFVMSPSGQATYSQ